MNSFSEGHSFLEAVRITLDKIKGSYALGILYEGDETCLIGARNEAPLVIGLGEGRVFHCLRCPSDPSLYERLHIYGGW